jgi:hypothetical protein
LLNVLNWNFVFQGVTAVSYDILRNVPERPRLVFSPEPAVTRPFVFMIKHAATNTILFMGRFTKRPETLDRFQRFVRIDRFLLWKKRRRRKK